MTLAAAAVPAGVDSDSSGGDRATIPTISPPPRERAALAPSVSENDEGGIAAADLAEGTAAVDGEAAPWPDENAESAFLAEQRGGAAAGPAPVSPVLTRHVSEEKAAEDDKAPLPALDSLVQRIPPEARETLEELFRAKFFSVKRVPGTALK